MLADQIAAASIAVGLAIFAMSVFRCLHPPGAATALIMVLNYGAYREFGWQWVGYVVLLNALFSLLAAIAINSLIPGRRYLMKKPESHVSVVPLTTTTQIRLSDIEQALTQLDSMIDVSEDDLITIYEMASKNAHENNRS